MTGPAVRWVQFLRAAETSPRSGPDRTEYSCGTSADCAAAIPRLRRLCWQGRVRTCDLWINSPSLCQLSYLPLLCWCYFLVGDCVPDCFTGTQLPTKRWSAARLLGAYLERAQCFAKRERLHTEALCHIDVHELSVYGSKPRHEIGVQLQSLLQAFCSDHRNVRQGRV